MIPLLTTYWLEGLLALGFVLLLALPFIWLHREYNKQFKLACENGNKIVERINSLFGSNKLNTQTLGAHLDHILLVESKVDGVSENYAFLKSRLDLLDKPSNDKALENIAVILKKKISKQPTKLHRPRTLKKANGRSHATR